MFIQNISSQIQTWVDTWLPWLGTISVIPGEIFQCADSVWLYLSESYEKLFKILLTLPWGGWEVNIWQNIGAWVWSYAWKTWVALQFKSLIAWTNTSISSDADEITVSTVVPEMVQYQVDFNDNAVEYITVGDASLFRAFLIDYVLDSLGYHEVWYMYITHNWVITEMSHEYSWTPSVTDEVLYSTDILWSDLRLKLESINVWSGLKFRYTVKGIDIPA
jgi:hypothetical protein